MEFVDRDTNEHVTGGLESYPKTSYTNLRIKDIGSVRLSNALSSFGIFTLDDLLSFINKNGIKRLLRIRNFGKNSLNEVEQIIESYISRGNLMASKAPENISVESIPADNDTCVYIPNLQLVIVDNYFGGARELAVQNINTTVDLFFWCSQNGITDLCRSKAFSKGKTQRIMSLLAIMQDRNKWSELRNMMSTSNKELQVTPMPRPSKLLFSNIKERVLTEIVKLIQQLYSTRIENLSVRAQNVVKSEMPYFGDAMVYSFLYRGGYKWLRNCGKKTWEEISDFNIRFYNDLKTIILNTPLGQLEMQIATEALRIALAKTSYESKSSEEMQYLRTFWDSSGHLPMFYLLSSYLSRSEDKFEVFYRLVHGILCEPVPLTQVAKQYRLSRERIRQIIAASNIYDKHGLKNNSIVASKYWAPYHIEKLLYLSSNSVLYKYIKEHEQLNDLSFIGFGYLCTLLRPFSHIEVRDSHYFVAKQLLNYFNLKDALEDIEATLTKKVSKNVSISITAFMDCYWKKTPNFNPNEVAEMLSTMIVENYDVQIDENLQITLFQNSIDIATELYDIIKANGTPMGISEIFKEFKQIYPNHKFRSVSQIRSYLTKDERICPIGKTSCYSLREWNLYTGTIRDLIVEKLTIHSLPLTANELYEDIKAIYNTTPKNIRSSIVSDKSGRFIFFKGGHIGLASKSYPDKYNNVVLKSIRSQNAFLERIGVYERYLKTHHHMPFSTGTEEEKVLYRWYSNVVNKHITITPDRETAFNAMVARNADYMVNGTEYSFYRRCDEYKAFLDENMELPTMETDTVLYRWFHNNIKIYMEFDDRRKGYFEDLLEFIQSYGFFVH